MTTLSMAPFLRIRGLIMTITTESIIRIKLLRKVTQAVHRLQVHRLQVPHFQVPHLQTQIAHLKNAKYGENGGEIVRPVIPIEKGIAVIAMDKEVVT